MDITVVANPTVIADELNLMKLQRNSVLMQFLPEKDNA